MLNTNPFNWTTIQPDSIGIAEYNLTLTPNLSQPGYYSPVLTPIPISDPTISSLGLECYSGVGPCTTHEQPSLFNGLEITFANPVAMIKVNGVDLPPDVLAIPSYTHGLISSVILYGDTQANITQVQYSYTHVVEPGTFVLFAIAALVMIFRHRNG